MIVTLEIVLLSPAFFDTFGVSQVIILLAKELVKKNDVSIISPKISESIKKQLESYDLNFLDLNMKGYINKWPFLYFEPYLREAFFSSITKKLQNNFHINEKHRIVSFTGLFNVPGKIGYGLGLLTTTLGTVAKYFPWHYRRAVELFSPLIHYIDRKFITRTRKNSKIFIAGSEYCKSLYEKRKIKVNDVIYPPIDCTIFKPTTSAPSSDYLLSYIGKEVQFGMLKKIADLNVKIKVFGSKISYVPNELRNHHNIEILGYVSQEELLQLYSNAYYTIFPFSDEVFGYIPIESMACGTPVLTYRRQGPMETVKDMVTGWLVNNEDEMINVALKLKSREYPIDIRSNCRKHSLNFDVKNITKQWIQYIEK